MSNKTEVPALDRGLDILELVSSRGSVGFGEIVESLKLPTASVARILKRFCDRKYLFKDSDSGVYQLGQMMRGDIGSKSVAERLQEVGASVLTEMRDKTSQTAILFHWNGQAWKCIGKELHENSMTMQNIGEVRVDIFRYPWSCFVYSQLKKEKRRLTYKLDNELSESLDKQISEFEKDGFVIQSSNLLHRLSVPIADSSGDLIGVLAFGITPSYMDMLGQEFISQLLIESGKKIEKSIK